MIYIKEGKPRKVSGLTSFYINSGYNASVIECIKESPCFSYSKKENLWEIPSCELSRILDSLTFIDDIELTLMKEEKTCAPLLKPVLQYKTKPFEHQLEAITYSLNKDKWLLLDGAGLGKTLISIYSAEELRKQKGIEHCLIICGIATLRANWEKEIKKHSDLSYVTIGKKVNSKGTVSWSSIKERAEQLKNKIDEFFVIVNVESLTDDLVIDAINKSVNNFDLIIFDEMHKAKGFHASRSKNLLDIEQGKYRIGLSGTLIMNNALDSYIPLKWIDVEHSTLTNFKNLYCKYGGFGGHEVVGYKNLDILKEELESCSLRRTKDLIDLPPKTIIDEYIEMTKGHAAFYENVKKGVKEECDKIVLKPNNILALTTRLRQATTCPSILTSNNVVSTKIERCVELVDDIIAQGDKVVIISSFKEPVYQLKKLLAQYNPVIGTGDLDDAVVSNNIDKFQTDPKYKVFIGTASKCGTGITLNAAKYMICIDQPWTYALYEQITDRIHRINNTEPVFIYNLICENTIDVSVSRIINRKKLMSDFIIDDKADNEALEILRDYIEGL